MSGKIYTMKEMKTIVEYLVEHKAYGEVKGRKMWIDFANSSLTNRTWQSLKETFLKRILPDIHNPYYGLSREQIFSFRQGYDIKERDQNKLEIEAVGEDSNSNGENPQNIEKHIVSSADNGEQQGETNKCDPVTSKNRPSQESSEPQNCYKTVDDIRRDLESPMVSQDKKEKSLNQETIPPTIQNVLNDFASDSEEAHKIDNESRVIEIEDKTDIEHTKSNNQDKTENSDNNIEILDTDAVVENNVNLIPDVVEPNAELNTDTVKNEEDNIDNAINEPCVTKPSQKMHSENDSNKDEENQKVDEVGDKSVNTEVIQKDESHDILEATSQNGKHDDVTTDNKKENQEATKKSLTNSSQNLASTNSDSILPNNQEGLENSSKTQTKTNNIEKDNDTSIQSSRKRGSSIDTVVLEKKRTRKTSQPSTSKQSGALNKDASESDENLTDPEVFDVDDSSDIEAGLTTPPADDTSNNKEHAIKIGDTDPETQNPCLKSVSLFAEQFNKTNYSDSSCNEEIKRKKDGPKPSGSRKVNNTPSKSNNEDVVVLKSHSESDGHEEPKGKKQKVSERSTRVQREKAFANVFGFTHGGPTTNTKRKSTQGRGRRPVNSKKNAEMSCSEPTRPMECNDSESDSSGWTTETEQGNFVFPPRGRRHKHSKKYLKPKSARILSLEEEGGLFVMYGKRVYPIVKDGRIVKNYVIYESNSDSGFDQESYWKVKYAELKKKYEEHKKRKEQSDRVSEQRQSSVSREPTSPILQPNIRKPPPTPQKQDVETPSTSKTNAANDNREIIPSRPAENTNSNSKITIKYIVNNAEVQLEGHWPQICPMFDKVVNILPNKMEPQVNEPKLKEIEEAEQAKVIVLSGESTPVIAHEDAAARVEKLESEIFKKIAEKYDEEEATIETVQKQTVEEEQNTNVSSRKRSRKAKVSSAPEEQKTPRKQPRLSEKEVTPPKNKSLKSEVKSLTSVDNPESPNERSPNVIARRTRHSLKAGKDTEKVEEPKQRNSTKQTKVNKSGKDDSTVKYMLPPSSTVKTRRSSSRTPSASRVPKPRSLVDQVALHKDDTPNMSESTQGYQDSDISPLKLKKKKKIKLPTITYRNKAQSKRNLKKRSQPYLIQEISTDSSNSSIYSQSKNKTSQNSSEIYKSESYQNLFPRSRVCKPLAPIHETSPFIQEIEMNPIDSVFKNPINVDTMETDTNIMHGIIDGGSSSNVSLPQSPELSVVEDISIGKDFVKSIRQYYASKNVETNEVEMQEEQSKYLMTDVDITLPLMEQICELQRSNPVPGIKNNSQRQKKVSVSESLINKICTVNINDNSSVSDSLDIQLRDLLLESAKKMSKVTQTKKSMEVDENNIITKKKRCSTPRKRKEIRKSLLMPSESVVEHMEVCAYGGRKSCPPSIQVYNENAVDCGEIHLEDAKIAADKPKGRRKKDVIKVKILRPRNKSNSSEKTQKSSQKISRMSICTDSGINGTASGNSFPISNDSEELIHNHSETCLHANECVDNSVEFVNASRSIISLNSNSICTDWQDTREFLDQENISLCLLNNNDKDFVLSCNNGKTVENNTNDSKSDTIYRSPANTEGLNNSLITEDLSDESPAQSRVPSLMPSRWYLFSEDETTNANFVSPQVANTGGFGSNLNQIFPITCAVPDLSTISEMSRENDSRKPTFEPDSFTRDSNSQNIFL